MNDFRPTLEPTKLAEILHGVQFAILYGSAVTGAMREESDIDLAVMYPSILGAEDVLRLLGELSAVFHRYVDLLDLRRAGPIIKMQVLRHGRPVIINDDKAFKHFSMYTPSEYFDFKLQRRPIEEAIKAGMPS